MPEQPNKPGTQSDGGTPGTEPAVENQGGTTPEAYPDPAGADDMGGVDRK